MNPPNRQHYKNRVLASLPRSEINRLAPHLAPVTLKLRTQLLDGRADYAFFLEEGLASVVLPMKDGSTVEVGVIGKDGVVGLPILLGAGEDARRDVHSGRRLWFSHPGKTSKRRI